MAQSVVLLSSFDGIATITLNKPEKHNAMDGYLVQQLINTFEIVAEDDAVNVVLLNANGENFCAGGDLAWMHHVAQGTPAENTADAGQLANLMHVIYQFPKPVIVLAQGAIFGGGLGLVAASDIVVATQDASFAFSEVRMGLTPSVISPYVMLAMGERAARYYFLTAKRFGASEAHRLGLIHHIVDPEALWSVGLSIAHELAQHCPLALSEVKYLIRHVSRQPITGELIRFTAEHLAKMRSSANGREGMQAFLAKRLPKWPH